MAKRIKNRAPTPTMLIFDVNKLFHDEITSVEKDMQNSCRSIVYYLSLEDGVSQLKLSQLTHLKPPTISITLRAMEADGYVERRIDENDKRQVNVYLTPKGKRHDEKMRNCVNEFEKKAMRGFTEEEKATISELLTRMKNNLCGEEQSEE